MRKAIATSLIALTTLALTACGSDTESHVTTSGSVQLQAECISDGPATVWVDIDGETDWYTLNMPGGLGTAKSGVFNEEYEASQGSSGVEIQFLVSSESDRNCISHVVVPDTQEIISQASTTEAFTHHVSLAPGDE